jgi:hypothetical protein
VEQRLWPGEGLGDAGARRAREEQSMDSSAERGRRGRQGVGVVRQGDLLLVPIGGLPEGARPVSSGRLVLARGEATGHAHVVDDERASLHSLEWPATRYLRVVGDQPVSLVHEEHDRLEVQPGVYEVRRQREYEPSRASRWVSD